MTTNKSIDVETVEFQTPTNFFGSLGVQTYLNTKSTPGLVLTVVSEGVSVANDKDMYLVPWSNIKAIRVRK